MGRRRKDRFEAGRGQSCTSSSNRAGCKVIFSRVSEAGSMVVCAVGMSRRMMGLRGVTLPRFRTQSGSWEAAVATKGTEWVSLRPGRTSRSALRRGRVGYQAVACVSLNGSPVISMVCMMTASLRATATAARLNPSFSRSCSPHWRRSHSDLVRVSSTVAAS